MRDAERMIGTEFQGELSEALCSISRELRQEIDNLLRDT